MLLSFLAILQAIDKSLYEAAEMIGANAAATVSYHRCRAIMPVLATVTLRTIWMFYMFADVFVADDQVDILGVYLYKTAFAFNDLGKRRQNLQVLFCSLACCHSADRAGGAMATNESTLSRIGFCGLALFLIITLTIFVMLR